jgi:hypothetical protein
MRQIFMGIIVVAFGVMISEHTVMGIVQIFLGAGLICLGAAKLRKSKVGDL